MNCKVPHQQTLRCFAGVACHATNKLSAEVQADPGQKLNRLSTELREIFSRAFNSVSFFNVMRWCPVRFISLDCKITMKDGPERQLSLRMKYSRTEEQWRSCI